MSTTHEAEFAANPDVLTATAQGRLKSFVERIERLEEDKAAIMGDLKEVFLEAKGEGFDSKIMRKVIRLRKQDKAKRQEEEALIDLYLSAIGDLPLMPTRYDRSNTSVDRTDATVSITGPGGEVIMPPTKVEDFSRAARRLGKRGGAR